MKLKGKTSSMHKKWLGVVLGIYINRGMLVKASTCLDREKRCFGANIEESLIDHPCRMTVGGTRYDDKGSSHWCGRH